MFKWLKNLFRSEWVDVTQSVPAEGEFVVALHNGKKKKVRQYHDKKLGKPVFYDETNSKIENVTHWRKDA